jgi:peroxiredoxin
MPPEDAENRPPDPFVDLPAGLPVPQDDGAATHLRNTRMPTLALPSTDGRDVRVDAPPAGFERLVLYFYPKTGRPGVPMPAGWDGIPGARGCTPEACGFRDHAEDLAAAGASVAGVSSQTTADQLEAASRLGLPFPLLSDSNLVLTDAIGLPTFRAGGEVLIKRLTLVVRGGLVEHVFYPVYPPDRHAEEVLRYIRSTGRT